MPTYFARDVGRFLAKQRKAAGVNQRAVADHLGMSQQVVSRWEQGAAVPSLEHLIQLSEMYGFYLNELRDVYDRCVKGGTPSRHANR